MRNLKFREFNSVYSTYIKNKWKLYQIEDHIKRRVQSLLFINYSLDEILIAIQKAGEDKENFTFLCVADNFYKDGFYIAIKKPKSEWGMIKMTNNKGIKARAIASELEIDLDDVSHSYDNTYECEGIDYTVLNEDERTEAVTSYIKDSVWAFNSSFLSDMTDIDEDVFKILSEKCEDGNGSILNLIEKTCGLEAFVEKAATIDGYGHFLSSYDGNELELENDLYAYKQ